MSLDSRLFEVLKSVDGVLGRPAARLLARQAVPLPQPPGDVLVLRLWGLGNLALIAPHLQAMRAVARLRLVTLERNADFVASQLPWVEACLLPDPGSPRLLPALLAMLRGLRRRPPDVIVDLEQFLRLPLAAVRLATRAPTVGLDTPGQGRRPLLDHPVPHDPTRHVADTFTALWRAAGLRTGKGPGTLRAHGLALPRHLPSGPGPLVVLHPGSGDHFVGRRWPAERFGALARELRRTRSARLVLSGVRGERALTAAVAAAAGPPVLDTTGQLDTDGLLELIAAADLLVTNDTGPLHLADAVRTRAVALYGPNTPHRYGPRLPGSRAVFADLPCSPCLDDRSMKHSSCRDPICMQAIDVATVARACLEVLDAGRPCRTVETALSPRESGLAVPR